MRLGLPMALAALVAALGIASPATADDFYKGKTLTIMVGFSPGGGFDTNARLLARHIGRFIPGNPTVVVVNAPGAASATSVVRLDVNLPTDGTVIDEFNFGLLNNSLLQPDKTKIDFRKYSWIGSISEDITTCYIFRDNGPKNIADMKAEGHHVFGATGVGTSEDINTKILQRVFGIDIKQATGLSRQRRNSHRHRTRRTRRRLRRMEQHPEDWTKSPKFHPVLRTAKSVPDGMSSDVPYVLDIAPNETDRKLIRFLVGDGDLGRPFITSHAVPADRIRILRKAFTAAVKNKDFIADAAHLRLPISPTTGEDAAKAVDVLYQTPPEIIDAARKIVAK